MLRFVILACAVALPADAIADGDDGEAFVPPPPFAMFSTAIGGITAAPSSHPYQTSSRIAALPDGALVIDGDSGDLLRVDGSGALVAEVAIGRDAGLLAYDDQLHRAYVADRRGDRIVVVDVGERLAILEAWRTPREPYAVALSPDRSTVYATMATDQLVVALDAASGRELWRAPVDPEPRGLAITNDGRRAAVTSLTSSSLDELDLTGHQLVRHALPAASELDHPRGAFAVTYLGDVAVTAFESERPVAASEEGAGHYGGSFFPPIEHQLAFIDPRDHAARATTNVHEPRALAWDPGRDALYVAGLATDNIVEVRHASQVDLSAGDEARLRAKTRCGADGLAIGSDGQLLVWCSLSRQVAHVMFSHGTPGVKRGPELVASSLDATQHKGLELFHTADANISAFGGVSCGNCHLEGRSDGESWQIHGTRLQTPMLCGRMTDTAPFKWDGTAPTLTASLRQTIERLGGSGLAKRHLAALAAYLEVMPPAPTPTRDADAIAHGKQLFESGELGCASCHDGPAYTDRQRHSLGKGPEFDTPSLIGVAHSAPYFHDGSAATLDVVLRDRGHVHGMTDGTALTDRDVADLKAFLESL
jgi:mono/diheme cytochrome c family protein